MLLCDDFFLNRKSVVYAMMFNSLWLCVNIEMKAPFCEMAFFPTRANNECVLCMNVMLMVYEENAVNIIIWLGYLSMTDDGFQQIKNDINFIDASTRNHKRLNVTAWQIDERWSGDLIFFSYFQEIKYLFYRIGTFFRIKWICQKEFNLRRKKNIQKTWNNCIRTSIIKFKRHLNRCVHFYANSLAIDCSMLKKIEW